MHIVKKYWEWNEDFNTSEIKLGMDIHVLLDKGLVVPDRESKDEYIGTEKISANLFSIGTFENKIASIWYRSELYFFRPSLWGGFK